MPSAVIGFGSAMMIMPGLRTMSLSMPPMWSEVMCGLSVTMSMPWHWVGRDCTPLSRKNRLALRIASAFLPGAISATILL